jgi:hypothetical protein
VAEWFKAAVLKTHAAEPDKAPDLQQNHIKSSIYTIKKRAKYAHLRLLTTVFHDTKDGTGESLIHPQNNACFVLRLMAY